MFHFKWKMFTAVGWAISLSVFLYVTTAPSVWKELVAMSRHCFMYLSLAVSLLLHIRCLIMRTYWHMYRLKVHLEPKHIVWDV